MTDHAAGTSNGVTNNGHVESKSSLGGFFKRLSSPKFHRSRSKSPMTNGSNRSKNKSWVTVEIKNGVDTTDRKSLQTSPNVVRSGTDGHLSSTTTTSCSTSSVPGSPMSSSSLHNGFSPSSPSRVRSSFGNLFSRGSFKKQHQQKSATLQQQSSTTNKHDNYETRTRTQSEQELNDDVEKRRIPKSSTTAKSKFDAFIAQLSHKTHSEGGRDSSKNSLTQQPEVANAVGRAALSEENLVSKSFVCENTSILFSPDPIASSTSTTNGVVVAKFPPANCLSTSTGYHSQDSVFDSPPTVAARLPSYVRLSCTLSGYKNYRNVDIRTPSPVRSPQMPRIVENFSSSSTTIVDDDGQQQQNPHPHNNIVHQLPAGKSLVERRLEKFQAMKLDEKKPSVNETTTNSADSNLASNGVTPTPIRDIISSFNKLNLNDSSSNTTSTPLAAQRPRQKPPPVPPRFDSQLSDEFENYNLTKSNGFKENSPPTTTNGGSLLNDVLLAADAVQSTTNVSNDTFSNSNVDFYATIESKTTTTTTTTMNSTEAAISAVVVEPVNSYVDKNIVVVSEQRSNGRTIKVDDDDDVAASTAANGIETLASTNFYALSNDKNGNGGESLMNGHDYRIIANQQRERLEKLLKDAENDLCDQTIPENASEKLRMAVGKLRLLLRKKFATFEDLIEKNLNPIVDDPRPTLDLDLDGYYQLVKIELDDIDNYFGVVERLRANGWCACESDDEVDSKPSAKQTGKKIIPVASKSTTSVTSTSTAAASKAKEAARQRLKDARNAALERQKATATTNADNVQFFGP